MSNLFFNKKQTKQIDKDWDISDPDWEKTAFEEKEEPDWNHAWDNLENKILKDERKQKIRHSFIVGSVGIAAVFAVILTFSLLSKPEGHKVEFVTLTNNEKVAKSYLLSDSSLVTLYPDSKLILSDQYNVSKRELRIIGKADFKVFKNKQKAFIVYSSHLTTEAIGTEFLVENRVAERKECVYLQQGIIQVNISKQNVGHILAVGDEVTYDFVNRQLHFSNRRPENTVVHHEKTAQRPSLARKGRSPHSKGVNNLEWYSFDNISLNELFDMLQEIYGKRIEFKQKSIGDRYFIGKFEKSDSLDHIMNVITSLNGLGYNKITNGDYEVYQKN